MVNSRFFSARSTLIAFHASLGEAVASLSTRRIMSPLVTAAARFDRFLDHTWWTRGARRHSDRRRGSEVW